MYQLPYNHLNILTPILFPVLTHPQYLYLVDIVLPRAVAPMLLIHLISFTYFKHVCHSRMQGPSHLHWLHIITIIYFLKLAYRRGPYILLNSITLLLRIVGHLISA